MPTPLPRYNMVPAGTERKQPLLSRHAHRRAFLASLPTPPPPPPGDYEVTGTLTPDATGTYLESTPHDGKPTYIRDDYAYLISWQAAYSAWWIFTLSPLPFSYWSRSDPSVDGMYNPTYNATGIATVTAI